MVGRSGSAIPGTSGNDGRVDAVSPAKAGDSLGPQPQPSSGPATRVGTSGRSYPNWRGLFYPPGIKPADWLGFYARRFTTVELNASFYRLPSPAMIERWVAATPPGFQFAVKAWRAVTHERRLEDCAEPLQRFLARIRLFGGKLGPILFQLPPRFPADSARLARFLALLPLGHRYAFEFRDPSWWHDEVYMLLEERGAAFVGFDLAGLRSPRRTTGPLAYVRLHGCDERYRGRYPASVLEDWAGWLAKERAAGREVLAYLDNTMDADDALRDAGTIAVLLGDPVAASGAGGA
jgi:uncharacterized protein YecE (DUF72 family)